MNKKIIFGKDIGKINQKGQFFSPDVMIAVSIFIFGLIIFFIASSAVFAEANLVNERRAIDETIHPVLDSLLLSQGVPENWEQKAISDVNSIGLVWSNNCLDKEKLLAFKDFTTNYYSQTKQLLGIGGYDFYFEVVNNSGEVLQIEGIDINAGTIVSTPKQKLSYQRIICFNDLEYILETVVSFERK